MPVRETFWNIPHWAEIGQYILGLLALTIFAYGVFRRIQRWRMGQAEARLDQLGKRLWALMIHGFAQLKTAEDAYSGLMHLTIFWGMAALVLGTALATVDWDVTHLFFDFQFLQGNIYVVYELVLDVFGILLIVGLAMAMYRRYIIKPDKFRQSPRRNSALENAYVLVMLALICITGYLVEGLRIAVTEPAWAAWSPIGNAIGRFFIASGDPNNRGLHMGLWTAHGLLAFISVASVPFTKFFHIFAAPVNIFFQNLEPAGTLAPARSSSSVGVRDWKDFTWKQILDFEACIQCGRCHDQCPVQNSGHVLSPRDIMAKLDAAIWARKNGKQIHGDIITAEELWGCTTCRACVEVCPVFTDQLSSLIDLRRHLAYEGEVDRQLQDALANLGRYGNSFGKSERARAKWTRAVKPKIKDARRNPCQYLWFVGDYASYHPVLTDISTKTAQVLRSAEVDFGILYDKERNAGNDVRRAGEEGLFELLVEENTEVLKRCKFETIVTTDPHSYNSLLNEYPALESQKFNVMHICELLDELIAEGRLEIRNPLGMRVTYQDPCYLGRYNGIYDAPRRVIRATGCELVEMPQNREKAVCCGAGGGRIWMEESEVEERPSETRMHEAAELEGVEAVVVACPKDISMFKDAVKTTGYEDQLAIYDLVELVDKAITVD